MAGIVILQHSYEKYHSGHDSWAFFAIAGLVFIIIAVLHHTIAQKAPWIDGVFFAIEGILSYVMAYDYYIWERKVCPPAILLQVSYSWW
jgi:hypothetical protein